MTQLSETLRRPGSPVPAAVAGVALAGAIALGAFAAGFGLGSSAGVPQAAAPVVAAPVAAAAAPSTDRAAILGGLQSEYLRGVAGTWYVTAAGTSPAAIVSRLDSEYLREIAAGWYATGPADRSRRDRQPPRQRVPAGDRRRLVIAPARADRGSQERPARGLGPELAR